jgi:hypothetical protein
MIIYQAREHMSVAEAHRLEGSHLETYEQLVSETATVLKPDGQVLLKLIRNALTEKECTTAWENLRGIVKNRIAGGSRANAAGASLVRATLRDGTPGRMNVVPDLTTLRDSRDAVVGYLDRSPRRPFCHPTAFNSKHPAVKSSLPFIQSVSRVFQQHMPDRFEAQMEHVRATHPAYVLPGTPFTTMTLNLNLRTAAHTDCGDLPEGFGVLTCMRAGVFEGGELVFPRYRCAVRFGTRDVLLADVHEVHGNMPLVGVLGAFERMSCIFYYRTRMQDCLAPAEELARAKRLKKGDSLR